jgi:hypothetical protein
MQLRAEGENEAANDIARDVHCMLETFNHTTAPWAIEKFHMRPVPAPVPRPSTQSGAVLRPAIGLHASSWAAVAATDIASDNDLIKFRPSDGIKRTITEEQCEKPEAKDDDFRCIWIYGWPANKPLSGITERISQGAIFSMAYVAQHNAVCVIFQYASSALALMEDDARSMRTYGEGVYGKDHEVKYGEAYLENDDLQRMQPPYNERRRLTFARQQLFTNGMSEERFREDLISLVGRHNVELVWLFNTGNGKHPSLPSRTC